MAERGRYKTKQQDIILGCLKKQKSRFLTVNEFMECLRKDGLSVGQTTVYRGLERLADEEKVIKLPADEGGNVRYCFADKEELSKSGKLVCLHCGRFIPLECSKMEDFLKHIYEEHGFELDRQHTILYGCCEHCRKKDPET